MELLFKMELKWRRKMPLHISHETICILQTFSLQWPSEHDIVYKLTLNDQANTEHSVRSALSQCHELLELTCPTNNYTHIICVLKTFTHS